MNRCCFRFWLLLWLCGPTGALALEIGEIQVQSALNQLFDARIPLPALTPEELAKVSVKLAPPPAFKEFGLDRSPTLDNLVFAIEYNAEGQVYVRVVSTKPIREPSLGLLIEFGWPRGKTFREFTVFLDPVRRLAKQPGDRSKTVLNTPSAAPSPAPESVPAPEVAVAAVPPETGTDAPAADDRFSPVEPVITVASEVVEAAESAPEAAASAPEPLRIYRPGDTYGPVASGEGLWAIALKVRPDPAISREQMMQALFKGNPQAFGKTGIPGLKAGTVLRIPTWREIADFTGSPVARQWAEKESPPDSTQLAATPPAPEPAPVTKAGADAPEVFPLPAPLVLEPQPLPETARATADPVQPPPSLVIAPTLPEPPPIYELIASSSPLLLEPTLTPELVSATPLLSLMVAELIAGVNPIAPVALAWTTVVGPPVDGKAIVELAVPVAAATPLPVVTPSVAITPEPAIAAAPQLSAVTLEGFRLLAEIEQRLPSPVFELLPPVEALQPSAIPIAPPLALPPPVAEATKPITSAVTPISDRYGPVVANERLWDIADRVRPDPAIGREHMIQALFKANPQAFSKPGNRDSLKVGVMLRVPTLQEIADYTGSKAAKELLERPRPAAATPQKDENP